MPFDHDYGAPLTIFDKIDMPFSLLHRGSGHVGIIRLLILALLSRSPLALDASAQTPAKTPYAPFAFLIGDWDIRSATGGSVVAGAQFKWGPERSYIWYAGSLSMNGKQEPHFEGLLLWNGARRNLDMLIAVDLHGGLAQEQGSVSIASDSTVTREISATYSEGVRPLGAAVAGPEGTIVHFRQTFKATTADTIVTSVLRQSSTGWVATFPGSDRLLMTRRPTRLPAP